MDIEDLAQETMIVVINRLRNKKLEDPSRLAGYVQRTAQNLFIGRARLDSSRKTTPVADVPEVDTHEIEQGLTTVLEKETKQLVRKLLDELGVERDREILRQSYLLSLPKAVVCENLTLTPSQFDRVLYRAKRRLKDLAMEHLNNLPFLAPVPAGGLEQD